MKAILTRKLQNEVQTLGTLVFYKIKGGQEVTGVIKKEVFRCNTLELPWKDNEKFISCIPVGIYQVRLHKSPTFGVCFKVLQVPGRTHILIHAGNYYTQTKGCILVGRPPGYDINGDGHLDITNSKETLQAMMDIKGLPPSFEMEIDIDLRIQE